MKIVTDEEYSRNIITGHVISLSSISISTTKKRLMVMFFSSTWSSSHLSEACDGRDLSNPLPVRSDPSRPSPSHLSSDARPCDRLPRSRLRMKTDGKNPVPSRPYFYIYPVRFRIYGKIQKWDEKRQRVYPVCICGIPFLAGIILYFSRIYKIREKIIGTPYILSCSSTSIHVSQHQYKYFT